MQVSLVYRCHHYSVQLRTHTYHDLVDTWQVFVDSFVNRRGTTSKTTFAGSMAKVKTVRHTSLNSPALPSSTSLTWNNLPSLRFLPTLWSRDRRHQPLSIVTTLHLTTDGWIKTMWCVCVCVYIYIYIYIYNGIPLSYLKNEILPSSATWIDLEGIMQSEISDTEEDRYCRLPTWLSRKESTCQCRRHRFDLWVRKMPCRKKWQLTPVFLPGKSHGQRSLVGYNPRNPKKMRQDSATGQHMCVHAKFLQSRWPLCNPMDGSPPGSSVLGILQARILDWIATPFSRESSWPRDLTCVSYVSCIGKQVLYH